MSRVNDRDLEITSAQQLISSLKEPEEEKGREAQRQSPAFIRRITHGFSNALGLVLYCILELILQLIALKFYVFILYRLGRL